MSSKSCRTKNRVTHFTDFRLANPNQWMNFIVIATKNPHFLFICILNRKCIYIDWLNKLFLLICPLYNARGMGGSLYLNFWWLFGERFVTPPLIRKKRSVNNISNNFGKWINFVWPLSWPINQPIYRQSLELSPIYLSCIWMFPW